MVPIVLEIGARPVPGAPLRPCLAVVGALVGALVGPAVVCRRGLLALPRGQKPGLRGQVFVRGVGGFSMTLLALVVTRVGSLALGFVGPLVVCRRGLLLWPQGQQRGLHVWRGRGHCDWLALVGTKARAARVYFRSGRGRACTSVACAGLRLGRAAGTCGVAMP